MENESYPIQPDKIFSIMTKLLIEIHANTILSIELQCGFISNGDDDKKAALLNDCHLKMKKYAEIMVENLYAQYGNLPPDIREVTS